MRSFFPLFALGLLGCATSTVNEPSLARRSAEAIDPRIPIASEPTLGPVDPGLGSRLEQLVAQGKDGAATFNGEVAQAQALADVAGASQSESWIVAQQALSGLEGARARTTRALADIDAIAAERIQSGASLTLADQRAVETASSELTAVSDRQAAIVDRLSARLGR